MILDRTKTVCIKRHKDKTLDLAASELAAFLQQSPGTSISEDEGIQIEFIIRDVPGYSVSVQGERLIFTAPDPVRILYAVYTLAEEHLGFCFFEPGSDRVRPKDRVVFEDGIVISQRVPLMKNRGLIQEYPCDESNYRLASWMARNRLNYLVTWMKYYDQFSPEMKDYYRIRGIKIESGHHNFDYYIPIKKYGDSHPEYFAIRDGKRVTYEKTDEDLFLSKQLCVTNPDLRAQLSANMVDYAKEHPELDIIALTPNDGFGWCECENCSTFYDKDDRGERYCISEHVYKANRIYHDLIQDISKRIWKERPDLNVSFSAYINYLEPAEGFKLGKGLIVHVATYWRCINHKIDDPACPINRRYLQSLVKWGKVKQGGVFNIYEYYMGVNFYLSLPMIHHEVIFDELRALSKIGVDSITTQYHLTHWTAYGLNFYMMAKAAYGEDPSVVEKCMSDLFGDDAEDAGEFYRAVRTVVLSAGPCHVPIPRPLLNRTSLDQYEHLRDMAQGLLDKNPDDRFRRNIVVWMDYIIRFKTLFDRYMRGEDVREGILEFEKWAEEQGEHDVCVTSRLKMYLPKWIEKIERGEPWFHFNIDWEDPYVERYDQMLNTDW